jgi:dihydroorotase
MIEGRREFDVVISGGHVIDPAAGRSGPFDVGIRDGVIASVEPDLGAAGALRTIDATGQVVTPGLIDLHTHIYWGVTYWGVEADPIAARSGVTTWIDVGSAGSYTFPGFREYIANRASVRVYAFLHLSSIGLVAPSWELANPDYWDVGIAVETVERNRDLILGIKVRIDSNTTRGVGIEPMKHARELADRVGLPLMTHIGDGPPSMEELVPYLRPGDILTHCFTGRNMGIMGADRHVRKEIRELQEQGLILDIGHGMGAFSFDVAETMLAEGILPDAISTDIHQVAVQGPAFDMPTTMTKFLMMGMSLEDIILRTTVNPARAVKLGGVGSLAIGQRADVALFRIEEGEYAYYDVFMNERRTDRRIVNTATLVDGRILPRVEERPLHFFAQVPEAQRPILHAGGSGGLAPGAEPVSREELRRDVREIQKGS